ncbi:MAG: STAS domain-containing protein [Alphaproteobacteria bacterium]|nr:STAS domain-containing protein [Alphaproteobacteria bacterium]
MNRISNKSVWWHLYVPKLFTVLQEGYSLKFFRADALAGLTVAIVAIPLAMALGIASGATPDKGLITAVVAGFLISALGGSRVQIGGPTGAFVVVVYNVIGRHGYDGLLIATMMAGIMLLIAGAARLGTWIKYIPQPVITGFTAGIAVIIFSSQIRDFFGLEIEKVPGLFLEKWKVYWDARDSLNLGALGVSSASLVLIFVLRKYFPHLPAFLLAVVFSSVAVISFGLPVVTIGSAFGELPHSLPMPHLPEGINIVRIVELIPSAFTIAFLAGVESLLSSVVADGMINRRHRSNCELVGQGIANLVSPLFGGLPATGAIARTVTNIRSGGKTPVSGIMHAVFILLAMVFLAPLASYIPLAALAAILMVVAWNMSEHEKIRHLLKAPFGERLVLVLTFVLTVAVDLTVAIEVGVVLAAILFMHQMAEHTDFIEKDVDDLSGDRIPVEEELPSDVVSYRLRGPLFFGVGSRLMDVVEQLQPAPKIFILRLGLVPMIDASGEAALRTFLDNCQRKGIFVILSNLQPAPRRVLKRMGLLDGEGLDYVFSQDFQDARVIALKRLELVTIK